jgi:hypothetical protein
LGCLCGVGTQLVEVYEGFGYWEYKWGVVSGGRVGVSRGRASRILEEILTAHHARADPSADPIYFDHPSAREDLHHPLLLRPAAPGLNSIVIENYYVTGVHSNNTQNYANFHVYIYLPNDYEHTTDVIDILTLQLNSIRTAGYPTTPLGIRDA